MRKGFAKESVHSLRFSYQFTEEDRKLEAQLLEGKEDAERERIQRNIVNERDSFMHHLMSNIASNFICINFESDRDDNTLFASVMWELYFWCNQFQDMAKEKPQLSQKQQYQRLTQAKAQALRNGQETPKLDRKIEKLRTLMGSAVQKSPPAKPSASKYANYKGVNKRPMQGGSVTPK